MPTGRPRRLRRLAGSCLVAIAVATVASATYADSVSPAQATPVQREQAQSRFLRGRELYSAKKYEAALAEFQASLDIVSSPNTRLYVGRCLRELGRLVAAYVELGRASVEANEHSREDPRYEKTGEAALEERKELEAKLGFLEIDVAHAVPTTTLKVAGDEVRRGGWSEPVPVAPGKAEVVVETPGHAPVTQTVEIAAGQRQVVRLDAGAEPRAVAAAHETSPSPATASARPAARRDLRPYAYAAAGVAAAGLVTFTAFGLMATSTHSDLESRCGAGPCPPGHEDDISAGRTQQTIANVGLAVAVVGAGAAVTLFVLSPKAPSGASAAQARVTTRGSSILLEGSF